jgi:hypothetical protein
MGAGILAGCVDGLKALIPAQREAGFLSSFSIAYYHQLVVCVLRSLAFQTNPKHRKSLTALHSFIHQSTTLIFCSKSDSCSRDIPLSLPLPDKYNSLTIRFQDALPGDRHTI